MISTLIHLLGKEFCLNDLVRLHYFLGIEVVSNKDGFFVNNTKYAIDLLERDNMTNCKPISTLYNPIIIYTKQLIIL